MCERLVIPDRAEVEQELAVNHPWWKFSTQFNVAAPKSVPVARMHAKESEGVMMRWGLVPAVRLEKVRKEDHERVPAISCVARSEIDASEDLRNVWLHSQRCIVPLAGFYLWQRTPAGHRQPFYVRLVNRPVFGVAALWDRFTAHDDYVIEGCALITVPANSLVAEIEGADARMPAILQRDDYSAWLSGKPAPAKALLRAYPAERMVTHAVGPFVNFLQYDDPSLIRPIT